MYGLFLENFCSVLLEKYGEMVWNEIVEKFGIWYYIFVIYKVYFEDIMVCFV